MPEPKLTELLDKISKYVDSNDGHNKATELCAEFRARLAELDKPCLTEEDVKSIIVLAWTRDWTTYPDLLASRLMPYLATREMKERDVAMRIWEKWGCWTGWHGENPALSITFTKREKGQPRSTTVTLRKKFGTAGILTAAREVFAKTGDPELAAMLKELEEK